MRRFSFLTLLTSLLIVGCTEVTIEQSNPLTEINSLPDLTASLADEGETRTFVEDSKYLRWHEADLITAFFGNTLNRQYKFKGKTGDNSGTFSLIPSGELGTGNDLSSIYAVYPYDENTTITDNGVISLTLPATQTYAENSFGKGANTMVAVTESVEDTFLSFKNACGYLKLKLYGDNVTIASIEVKGNNEEKIAGSTTATMEFGGVPTIAMNDEATTSVTLDCGEGVSIGATADTATEFWFVLPETTFEGGITITATNTDGAVFSKSTTNTVAITRNDIQPMVALKSEFATAKPANNEIWYTSSDASVVTPNNIGAFGANILSNVYENGMGIITFDGEVTKIVDAAFYGYNTDCSKLTSVIIPDSVTEIGIGAFDSCTSLTSVTIPDSVTEIGDNPFVLCTNLKKFEGKFSADNGRCLIVDGVLKSFAIGCGVTEYTIPDSVTEIGESAFNNCTSLTNITIPDSITTIGGCAFLSCNLLTSVTIGNSVTTIGAFAFENCSSLTSVTIPDSVTEIGIYAFRGCTSLTSITIPDSVTSIGYNAFYSCTALQEVYCKATTPPTVGGNMFYNNASGRKIYVPSASVSAYKSAAYWSDYADYIVGYNFETGEVVPETPVRPANNEIWYTSSDGSVIMPDSTEAFGANVVSNVYEGGFGVITFDGEVTTVGMEAFFNCTSLSSITISDSVTSIGDYAFGYCSLTSVTIPDSVTEIGTNPFIGCTNLKKFEGKFAADNGRCLIKDNVIISYANTSGTEYTIPDSVTTIGNYAFHSCISLTCVIIPDSVSSIGNRAFVNCYSLTNITIPDSITTIGNYAFSSCTSLTSVTIPDSVTEIGKSAFYYCESLTSVYCKATTPPSLGGSYVFDHNASSRTIYVPKNSVEAYKTTEYWSNYADYIVGYNY